MASQAARGRFRQGAAAGWALLLEVCGSGASATRGGGSPLPPRSGASPAALAGGPSRDLPLPLGSAHPVWSALLGSSPVLWLKEPHGPLACASQS